MRNKKSMGFAYLSILTSVLLIALNRLQGSLFVYELPCLFITGICLFLFAYELSTILIVSKKIQTESPKRMVSLYMLLKVIKILLFLAVVVIYALAVKIETQRFVLIAIVLYGIYLLFDTLFLMAIEKGEKKNNNEKI